LFPIAHSPSAAQATKLATAKMRARRSTRRPEPAPRPIVVFVSVVETSRGVPVVAALATGRGALGRDGSIASRPDPLVLPKPTASESSARLDASSSAD
jgi:hypothetical protein